VYPHHPYPYLLHLLHRAGSSGDVEAATSFTAAALIGAAPALEAQVIANPAARLRKKNVLRMNVLPRVPLSATTARSEAHVYVSSMAGRTRSEAKQALRLKRLELA
jgi:hypothetical protein